MKINAVRGPYTDSEIAKRGYAKSEIYGDPGLLMPLIFRPIVSHTCDVGIIPHIKEWKSVNRIANNYGYKVIDLRTDDVEYVTREILSCRCILSSSLHGLIFAHAYGVPALFFTYEHKGEGLFKYYDYFSSVGIKPYNPYELDELLPNKELISFIENNPEAYITEDLMLIQKRLLAVAPFKLRKSYKEFIDDSLFEEAKYLLTVKNRV